MIKPTVGRIVLFTPSKYDQDLAKRKDQPLAAIVAYVHSDTLVNLAVFDAHGSSAGRVEVPLIQDGEIYDTLAEIEAMAHEIRPDGLVVPKDGFYCEWMAYQKGQAAKTEELEKRWAEALDGKTGA